MTLYPRLFIQLIDGRSGGIAHVASIPTEVGVLFSAQSNNVLIDKACAIKIQKHRLSYYDLEFIQKAIDSGYVFRGREGKFLEFLYINSDVPYKHYMLVLKTARYGQEVWVQTFHRSDETTLRARLRKKSELLRDHT